MAVGSFEPGIEIWNLDTVDALQPAAIFGGFTQPGGLSRRQKKNKKKRPSKPKLKSGSHTSAVLGLSWNRHHRSLMLNTKVVQNFGLMLYLLQTCACKLWRRRNSKALGCRKARVPTDIHTSQG